MIVISICNQILADDDLST